MTEGHHTKLRLVARALIVVEKRVLCVEVADGAGQWWILPGGKVELGETMHEALAREIGEELDCEAEIGELLAVREFVGARHSDHVGKVAHHHSVEFYFRVVLGEMPDLLVRDNNHLRIAWIHIDRLEEINFYPRYFRTKLAEILAGNVGGVYLGEVP